MTKKYANDKPVTEEKLKEAHDNYPTKKDSKIALELSNEALMRDIKDQFIEFRSDIFTRMDEAMGELDQGREDRIFQDHEVKVLKEKADEHEERILKPEAKVKNLKLAALWI